MKRSMAVLAAVTLCGTAAAQSSVTLFGVVDTAVSFYRGEGTGSATRMTAGNLSSSRLGFRGVEDLGGGLSASFWLEAGLNTDDGQGASSNINNQPTGTGAGVAGRQGLTFNRRSVVSLTGSWGEVRLGRDYIPAFWNLSVFDPFGVLGSAQASNLSVANTTVTNARASNSIGYFSPGCSTPIGCTGFFGQVMHARGENATGAPASSDGNHTGARVGYAYKAFNAAIATGLTKNVAAGDFRQSNLGASYDFGIAKAMFQAGVNKSGNAGSLLAGVSKATFYLIGAQIPLGQGYIPISYTHLKLDNANSSAAAQLGVGYVHRLSARTALYAFYSRITNKNGTAASPRFAITGGVAVGVPNGSASGIDMGIRHSF
jgi:predicted porin